MDEKPVLTIDDYVTRYIDPAIKAVFDAAGGSKAKTKRDWRKSIRKIKRMAATPKR